MSAWALARMAQRCGGVDLRFRPRYLGMLARYAALAPLRAGQRQREARAPLPALEQDPVFVIGHWRSGTTYAQQLLAADPRHTTPTLFTSLFNDISLTGKRLEGAMTAVARLLRMQHSIQRQPLRLDLPAEGDVGLCLGQLSEHAYTWGHIFPRSYARWIESHVFEPSPAAVSGWLADYDALMRRLSALADGRRVVMKTPGDTARIPWLLERYPNARFVYLHRDPLAVYHSKRYLWGVIRREFALQSVDDDTVHRWIVSTYARLLQRYLNDRRHVPPGQLVELRYETLRREGASEVARVYDTLGLGAVPESVLGELRANQGHAPARYTTDPELERELRSTWGFAFENWSEEATAA